MSFSRILSMPFLLEETRESELFDHLSDPDQNSMEYARLNVLEGVDISECLSTPLPEGYELRMVEHRNEHTELEIFVLNHITHRVAFFNRVEKTDIQLSIGNSKPVKQAMIWRQSIGQDAKVTRDVVESVFFTKLVSEYNIVVSDSEQTRDGKRMWESLLFTAIETAGLIAGVGDASNGKVSLLRSERDLRNQEKWLWGQEQFHKERLGVIASI